MKMSQIITFVTTVKVQRVTVVEFGMYDRSVDGVGCLEVKVGANFNFLALILSEI